MKKLLLVRFGGLGDLLAVAPSIQLLRRQFPAARLTLVCREEYGNFLREIGLVDDVLRADGPLLLPLFLDSPSPDADPKRWLRDFDLVVAWLQDGKGGALESGLIASAGTQKCRVVDYGRDGKGEAIIPFFFQETQRVLEKLDKSCVRRPFEEYVRLSVPDVCRERGLSLLNLSGECRGEIVVVHPGSGSVSKCWPLRNFLEVVEDLGRKGLGGVLVTGEAESALDPVLDKTVLPSGWARLRSPSLGALAGLLVQAALYLGNDSGITHLASACGTQVIAIFRSEFADVWRPFGRVHLLRADSPEMISQHEVGKKIAGLIGLNGRSSNGN
jgi:ADP-heptose:LPS heptosyltransferase